MFLIATPYNQNEPILPNIEEFIAYKLDRDEAIKRVIIRNLELIEVDGEKTESHNDIASKICDILVAKKNKTGYKAMILSNKTFEYCFQSY